MKTSVLRRLLIGCIVIGLLVVGFSAHATNVAEGRHPNLAAAQTFIERAINRVTAAQEAHEFDLDGHAASAKALLDQAYSEIRLAATAANTDQ